MDTALAPQTVILRERQASSLQGTVLSVLFFYIIAFPKGGIKTGDVPITIGYVLTGVLLVLALLRASRLSLPLDRLLAFMPCLLLGLWSLFVLSVNGTESIGFTTSYFVSALYLPLFGLTFFSSLILDEHHDRIERVLVWAVRFIVVYGIFLFIFRQTTGKWIEIPYVTVNAADVGQLDDKHINRGGIFKLISTYNNGNVFGVAVAIMAPLYLRLEQKNLLRVALYVALFLTLSRTVWISAILILLLRAVSRGIRPLTLLYLSAGLVLVGVMISFLLNLLGTDLSFIFDSNLGGRTNQLAAFDHVGIIPQGAIGMLPEIVYTGILEQFGIPGLLFFVAHLVAAPLLLRLEGVRLLSVSRAASCQQGMLLYLLLAAADGAYSLIPVMMIFWMVAGMGFWYAHRQAGVTKERM
jgi:lipoprotein signal peptidase